MNQMNMLMKQNKPETIESLDNTVNEIKKLAMKLCKHPATQQQETNLGRCYNKITCLVCGYTRLIDSSD